MQSTAAKKDAVGSKNLNMIAQILLLQELFCCICIYNIYFSLFVLIIFRCKTETIQKWHLTKIEIAMVGSILVYNLKERARKT